MDVTVTDAAEMDATEIVAFVRTVPIFHTLSKDQLLPRLCPGCTEPVPADSAVVARLRTLDVLETDWCGALSRGKDCEGFPPGGESGRVGAYEVMFVTDQLRDLIYGGAPRSEFEKALEPQHFFSFPRYYRFLLKAGLVAPEHVERNLPKKLMSFSG